MANQDEKESMVGRNMAGFAGSLFKQARQPHSRASTQASSGTPADTGCIDG